METRVRGIVTREMRFKETSKILTLYTQDLGRISVMARGAYNPKSDLIANTQIFSHNAYRLHKGRSFYYINQADVVDSFYSIREDMDRMLYGSYMLELINISTVEEDRNEKLYFLLLKGLRVLSDAKEDFLKLIISYELKYISFLGYRPSLNTCILCNERNPKIIGFSIARGGVICSECRGMESHCEFMDIGLWKAMNSLLYTPLDEVFPIDISEDTMFKLHTIMVKYILDRIERKQFNSLSILDAIKRNGGI
ncbi:MAG: DNA repair protein RecO [Tissierellia bacterium]|nr:DNA repair protein RecO [Tissierellia bacterium]